MNWFVIFTQVILWVAILGNVFSILLNYHMRKRYRAAMKDMNDYHAELQRIVAIKMSEGKVVPFRKDKP